MLNSNFIIAVKMLKTLVLLFLTVSGLVSGGVVKRSPQMGRQILQTVATIAKDVANGYLEKENPMPIYYQQQQVPVSHQGPLTLSSPFNVGFYDASGEPLAFTLKAAGNEDGSWKNEEESFGEEDWVKEVVEEERKEMEEELRRQKEEEEEEKKWNLQTEKSYYENESNEEANTEEVKITFPSSYEENQRERRLENSSEIKRNFLQSNPYFNSIFTFLQKDKKLEQTKIKSEDLLKNNPFFKSTFDFSAEIIQPGTEKISKDILKSNPFFNTAIEGRLDVRKDVEVKSKVVKRSEDNEVTTDYYEATTEEETKATEDDFEESSTVNYDDNWN